MKHPLHRDGINDAMAAEFHTKMALQTLQKVLVVFVTALVLLLGAGCSVYYNTFFHARQAFNEAESARKKSPANRPSIRTSDYNRAIEKSLKVVENHPNSKYYDDALYVLAVSYYYIKQYTKSERRARELVTNYPESKYALEARLYMAKARLEQNEMDAAMATFEELFTSKIKKAIKTEAATALGVYHYDNQRYSEAESYFLAVRDSLGNSEQQKAAQTYIADGYYNRLKFNDALASYLQLLGMDPTTEERYHALFQAAQCSYRMHRIPTGRDYLETLIEDEFYFDSLGVLKLKLAEGYELQDDLDQAVAIYEDIAATEKNPRVAARANYFLGLIYQFDYDSLAAAKEYYDQVVKLDRQSEDGQDALQRSADIGKIEEYARTALDTAATQEMIDNAAYTQYQLAELYWLKLNKPDSAIIEMRYIIDSLPDSWDAPKAMIALAGMIREHEGDTTRADSILRSMLQRYPHSDFAPQALEQLGLLDTEADTGYAARYIRLAEDFLIDEENVDSARYYYTNVVDNYPESEYYLQARFALIWLAEHYESPGDSSIYYAYSEFVDSFSGTTWATEASRRLSYRGAAPLGREGITDTTDETDTSDLFGISPLDTMEDTANWEDPLLQLYKTPDGQEAVDMPGDVRPIEIREEFIYPTEAYATAFYGDIYFLIRLDFTGEVIDYIRKTSSGNEELDIRAEETVASMIFDTNRIPPDLLDRWFLYRFRVDLPPDLQ